MTRPAALHARAFVLLWLLLASMKGWPVSTTRARREWMPRLRASGSSSTMPRPSTKARLMPIMVSAAGLAYSQRKSTSAPVSSRTAATAM